MCFYRLLQKNLDAVALKVYKTTIRSDVVDEKRNSVKYIIEYYVKYRTPEQILEFCQKMQKEGNIFFFLL